MPDWLDLGAPMGISEPIPPSGGIFPETAPDNKATLEDLMAKHFVSRNHASFTDDFGEECPPAVAIVTDYVNAGFARLFLDKSSAEAWLGQRAFPAPLGNVTRETAQGRKHRVIQDLLANGVNSTVKLRERQVLPRPLDHALDLAALQAEAGSDDSLAAFIIDVKDAFMTVPLARGEMAYNCAELPADMRLKRPPWTKTKLPTGAS